MDNSEKQTQFEDRVKERMQNFNKGIDEQEMVRKRENYQIELRKNKRDEQIVKMRNNMLGLENEKGPINLDGLQTLTDVPPLHQEVPKSY